MFFNISFVEAADAIIEYEDKVGGLAVYSINIDAENMTRDYNASRSRNELCAKHKQLS